MSQSLISHDCESIDSDEKAQEEKLRNSYDEYGKMIEQKKKRKKLDLKIKQLKVVVCILINEGYSESYKLVAVIADIVR